MEPGKNAKFGFIYNSFRHLDRLYLLWSRVRLVSVHEKIVLLVQLLVTSKKLEAHGSQP